jgi:uncharacterized membrane protein (DUF4010 family)
VTAAVASAALLAWKERLAGFSLHLTEAEVRSAILLAILAFIIFPVLPEAPLDPWGLVEPRALWLTVILIAAIGFANYVLLKAYGMRGVELAGFLGGLVNSTVTVTELASRAREAGGRLAAVVYRGVLLSTAAMAVRNVVLLGILATSVLVTSAVPLCVMFVASLLLAWKVRDTQSAANDGPVVRLASPFSLQAALKFGVIFLVLQVLGTLAQRALGDVGFYAVSVAAGLVSSASGVAAAAALASHGVIPIEVAGVGAVLTSLASALVNLPVVMRLADDRALSTRLTLALLAVVALSIAAMFVPTAPLVSLAAVAR